MLDTLFTIAMAVILAATIREYYILLRLLHINKLRKMNFPKGEKPTKEKE
jgi:hypothetical protein